MRAAGRAAVLRNARRAALVPSTTGAYEPVVMERVCSISGKDWLLVDDALDGVQRLPDRRSATRQPGTGRSAEDRSACAPARRLLGATGPMGSALALRTRFPSEYPSR